MKVFFILCAAILASCACPNRESLSKSKDVYVLFEEGVNQKIRFQKTVSGDTVGSYYDFTFGTNNVADLTFSNMEKVNGFKIIDKHFLTVRKHEIITYAFLKTCSFDDLQKIFNGKNIFLIDKKEPTILMDVRMRTSVLLEM